MILKINDKQYPLQFGLGAVELYCDIMDCDIDDIDAHIGSQRQIQQLKAINTLTLCALKNGCKTAKPVRLEFPFDKDFDVAYSEFQNWLDQQPQTTARDIINEWKESKTLGVKVSDYYFEEVLDEDLKKTKAPAKKKSQSAK